jgi:membrane protease subunit (stomatin/prohibitin family)
MSLPQNLREYERALNAEIERQTAIKTANDSYMPRWLRGGDSVDKYNVADIELQHLLGAKEELAMFRRDLQRYEQQHASGDIAKAAGHDAATSGDSGSVASGINAAAHTREASAPHQTVHQGVAAAAALRDGSCGDVATVRPRTVKPLTPG